MTKFIAALVLSLGIAGAGFFVASGLVDSRTPQRFVEVKGLAERTVKSDEGVWTINFKLVSADLTSLYKSIDDANAKTKQFLMDAGFKSEEITSGTVTVTDNQSSSYTANANIPRYSADAGVTVATHNVDLVLASMQKTGALVQQGVVITASNVVFRYTKLNDIKPPMLDEATSNAKAAGLSFASNAKAKLGAIRQARQGLFTITDANSNYDSGTSVMKKVRIVTTIEYELW